MNDEVVIVVDPGSSSVKAGYSGDDVPTCIFPTLSSKSKTRQESIEYSESNGNNPENSHPIHRGVVKDWDSIEKLWYQIFDELGVKDTETMSIMLAESIKSSVADRSKWAEILFETFRAPSICIGNSSALTMFASGRTTGITVECGAGVTSSVPVFEGLALAHAAVYTDFGGQDITANLRSKLIDNKFDISFNDTKILKEKHCFVSKKTSFYDRKNRGTEGGIRTLVSECDSNEEMEAFYLPDGEEVSVARSDCTTELLNNERKESCAGGILNQVFESLSLCDESIKKELMQNVLLSGGTSLLPGLGDRLFAELVEKFDTNHSTSDGHHRHSNSHLEFQVYPSTLHREPGYTFQRKFAPWIGGSIIGSLTTHSELKISRQEWEEGAESSLWQTKCF